MFNRCHILSSTDTLMCQYYQRDQKSRSSNTSHFDPPLSLITDTQVVTTPATCMGLINKQTSNRPPDKAWPVRNE